MIVSIENIKLHVGIPCIIKDPEMVHCDLRINDYAGYSSMQIDIFDGNYLSIETLEEVLKKQPSTRFKD